MSQTHTHTRTHAHTHTRTHAHTHTRTHAYKNVLQIFFLFTAYPVNIATKK
jgi:hypothetical protein